MFSITFRSVTLLRECVIVEKDMQDKDASNVNLDITDFLSVKVILLANTGWKPARSLGM